MNLGSRRVHVTLRPERLTLTVHEYYEYVRELRNDEVNMKDLIGYKNDSPTITPLINWIATETFYNAIQNV